MFLIKDRVKFYKDFYKFSQFMYFEKSHDTFFNCFENKQEIEKGKEGTVYKTKLDNNQEIIIKNINLNKILISKQVNKNILNKTPRDINVLFNNLNTFTEYPSLIEIISFTLTNQLVFQKICPHFALNYYWEYDTIDSENYFIYYNEYINNSTLQEWSKTGRSEYEWINILIQIIFAIISLKKYYNMTHCDLYTKNILIQKIPPGGSWRYIINNKEYIIPNIGWVCLLNDFGFATIPDKLYVKWFYEKSIKKMQDKEYNLFDFNKLSHDLLSAQVFDNFIYSKNILLNSVRLIYNNNTDILNDTYNLMQYYIKTQNIDLSEIKETYNMDKQLNTSLLPTNLISLSF